MFTLSGTGSFSPVGSTNLRYVNTEREKKVNSTRGSNYDSVSISSSATGENRSFMEIVSRLSQEVRTSTTTGDIRVLHEQVKSGNYTPDPMRIAAGMLFVED